VSEGIPSSILAGKDQYADAGNAHSGGRLNDNGSTEYKYFDINAL
jgi:hypothetical protein